MSVFFHTQQIYFQLYVATRCSITTKTASTHFYMRVTREYVHQCSLCQKCQTDSRDQSQPRSAMSSCCFMECVLDEKETWLGTWGFYQVRGWDTMPITLPT